MQLSSGMIVNLITLGLGLAFIWYLKRNFGPVMTEVKENLFSAHSFILWILYSCVAMGVVCTCLFVSVQLGNEVGVELPSKESMSKAIKGR